MGSYAFLPLVFLRFWFFEAPLGLIKYFLSLNTAFFELFSLPLLIRTYFQPLKNEYRKGLVGFSRSMGIAVKTVLIFVDLLIFIPLLIFETVVIVLFFLFPIITVALLFY